MEREVEERDRDGRRLCRSLSLSLSAVREVADEDVGSGEGDGEGEQGVVCVVVCWQRANVVKIV